ncbi:MAG TPA: hypothetical protein VFV75_20435 [Candidatus Polarisedimenticolaceae bacterium]|nr:hypothetical protein [Candidatus Polarisedimenticolaceae bacterium]
MSHDVPPWIEVILMVGAAALAIKARRRTLAVLVPPVVLAGLSGLIEGPLEIMLVVLAAVATIWSWLFVVRRARDAWGSP